MTKITAYWGARDESDESGARRLQRTFSGLADIHSAFSRWYRTSNSMATAHHPFCTMPPQLDELVKIVHKGRQKLDRPRVPTPWGGYGVAAWNGVLDFYKSGFSSYFGVFNPRPSQDRPNYFEVSTPRPKGANGDLVNAEIHRQILRLVCDCWDANWGVVDSFHFEGRTPYPDNPCYMAPWGGWITRIKASELEKITLPPGCRVDDGEGEHVLITLMETPPDETNPAHLQALADLQKALAPIQY